MNAKTKALGKKMGVGAIGLIGKGISKVKTYLKDNERINRAAASEMDKRYPSGWGQSSSNINELQQIRKKIK